MRWPQCRKYAWLQRRLKSYQANSDFLGKPLAYGTIEGYKYQDVKQLMTCTKSRRMDRGFIQTMKKNSDGKVLSQYHPQSFRWLAHELLLTSRSKNCSSRLSYP